mmetsp:Transcript_38388/g.76925  ORF Transcript_38388/g.76925 Transcript_38388/m.76925 type:complete len:206 (+) Transcript_38388:456-1073(+)
MAGLLVLAATAESLASGKSPRKKAESLRIELTTFWSASVSGGDSARARPRVPGGAGILERIEAAGVRASSARASRERASAALTTSSRRKPRKISPSDEKKKLRASRALAALSSALPSSLSRRALLASARNGGGESGDGSAMSVVLLTTSRARVPCMSPAAPTATPPRTPSTLNADPSPVSRTATNFSSAWSRSIRRSTSKLSDEP